MSEGNRRQSRDEKQREAALFIALRTGLLKKCACHNEIYDPGQHDYQGACMVASFLINSDDPRVASFNGDRDLLIKLLKSICQPYSVRCEGCSTQTVRS